MFCSHVTAPVSLVKPFSVLLDGVDTPTFNFLSASCPEHQASVALDTPSVRNVIAQVSWENTQHPAPESIIASISSTISTEYVFSNGAEALLTILHNPACTQSVTMLEFSKFPICSPIATMLVSNVQSFPCCTPPVTMWMMNANCMYQTSRILRNHSQTGDL